MPFGGGGAEKNPPMLSCARSIEGLDWDWITKPEGKVPCDAPRMLSNWNTEQSQLIQIRRDRKDGSTTYRYCTYMDKKKDADAKLCLEFDIPPTVAAGRVATLKAPNNPKNAKGVFLDNEGKALNTITIESLIRRFAWDFPNKAIDISPELRKGTELHTWESLIEFLGGNDMWINPRTVQIDYCYDETYFHKKAAFEQAKQYRIQGHNALVYTSTGCARGNYHVYKSSVKKRDPTYYGQRAEAGTSRKYQDALWKEKLKREERDAWPSATGM